MIGGNINDYIDGIDIVIWSRIVLKSDAEIKSNFKSRCSKNLVIDMDLKNKVQEVGGFFD